MKKVMRFLIIAVLALSCLDLSAKPALAADYIAAEHTASNGCPYYIMVNRVTNTVTVYGLDAKGYYTVPVKSMVCSVGRNGSRTPTGNYSVTGFKRPWLHMVDNSYGQYATQFYGNYLFHSVCYTKPDPSTLMADEYNMLGSPASRGCVRLQTADAKWIYDNCASGTKVTIYDGKDPSPLGKPDTVVSSITPNMDNGWDPTDPREDNPWRKLLVTGLSLNKTEETLAAGETAVLTAARLPSTAEIPGAVTWSSSNPSVVTVDNSGKLTAVGQGTATVTAVCGTAAASCAVTVSGVLVTGVSLSEREAALTAGEIHRLTAAVSPSDATVPAAAVWSSSHPSVAAVDNKGHVTALQEGTAVITAAYRGVSASCTVTVSEPMPFDDVAFGAWYYDDVRYVYESGLFVGTTENTFSPEKPVTYAMAVQALYRMSGADQEGPGQEEDAWYSAAVRWAVGNGLLNGTAEVGYDSNEKITRQELAALLYRYETALRGRQASGYTRLSNFSDGQEVYLLARDAVSWAVGNKLLQAVSADSLQPAGYVDRAQAAAVLHRYCSMQAQ